MHLPKSIFFLMPSHFNNMIHDICFITLKQYFRLAGVGGSHMAHMVKGWWPTHTSMDWWWAVSLNFQSGFTSSQGERSWTVMMWNWPCPSLLVATLVGSKGREAMTRMLWGTQVGTSVHTSMLYTFKPPKQNMVCSLGYAKHPQDRG